MNPSGRPRSLRTTNRFSALLLALLWSGAPILAVLHANAEVHRYCVEHATLEETGRAEGDVAAAGATAASQGEPAPGHEGCAFARVCRFGQVFGHVVLDAVELIPAVVLAPPPLESPPLSLPLILVAPKTSPPA
jgi:hypothetical protein